MSAVLGLRLTGPSRRYWAANPLAASRRGSANLLGTLIEQPNGVVALGSVPGSQLICTKTAPESVVGTLQLSKLTCCKQSPFSPSPVSTPPQALRCSAAFLITHSRERRLT